MESLRVEVNKNLVVKVTQEDVDDIMSAALDSELIQGWCSEVNAVGRYLGEYASDQISRGGELWFFDKEDESYYSLDLEHFRKGLEQYLNSESSEFCILPEGKLDVGMIDAVAADQIIQYALFNEIVYG